jgi:hypothetical protein
MRKRGDPVKRPTTGAGPLSIIFSNSTHTKTALFQARPDSGDVLRKALQ